MSAVDAGPIGQLVPGSLEWLELSDARGIAHDPALPVCSSTGHIGSATLLGYAIDADEPAASSASIVESLARHSDPIRAAQRLAGRWALVVESAERSVMLHDAAGLRQIVWTCNSAGTLCASDPSLLARLGATESMPTLPPGNMNTPAYTNQLECWWPGTATPYRQVHQLLPNHVLDLGAGSPERYWPVERILSLSPDEATERGCDLLVRLLDAIARRFPLALTLTAGRDNRFTSERLAEWQRDA